MDNEQPTQTRSDDNREDRLIEAGRRDAGMSEATLITGESLPPALGALAGWAASAAPASRLPSIPNYTILSEIGRGGQGIVFKAVQLSTKRQVAVKVLLSGTLASERERRRFEREIDLVARLRHPNIVTVYDGGTTPEGHSYYAMEYIEGVRLDDYVRAEPTLRPAAGRQSVKNLLNLFSRICAAVSYAHQRGVIHRDLKPGNIRIDSNGEPHILDFGLAKVVGQEEEPIRLTVTGAFVGTLAYAAPEQVQGRLELLGTVTDVYALGVILYEMLTGHFPYPVVGTMAEVLRNIAEVPPERPSSWHQRSRTSRDYSRPKSASHRVDGELETIILKALAKEPDRRYPSAEQMRRDIDNYLTGRPVEAKPDSALYVLRKLALRHWYATAVFVFLLVSIVAFALISFDFYRQAQNALAEKSQSDAVALQRSQDLGSLGKSAEQTLRRMVFDEFLLEWDQGDLGRARQIRDRLPTSSPEYIAASFLLDEDMSLEALLARLNAESRGLGCFVAGERYRKEGHAEQAAAQYRAALRNGEDAWLARKVERRMNSLRGNGAVGSDGVSGER
ncbi:MAG TPA: serine/threonine-protein kinase [Phycisphaerae bacterium]|nr:serine/threonine-protein kinase [Phycisphaerae bacterium]